MWLTDIDSCFASLLQKDDFQIKRFIALLVTIGPTFNSHKIFFLKDGRHKTVKKGVWLTDIRNTVVLACAL